MAEQPPQADLEDVLRDARSELERSSTPEALETWRVSYLGRHGRLTLLLRNLASLGLAERRIVGAETNRAKTQLEQLLEQRQQV